MNKNTARHVGRIKILHSVGHLLRGGIETWLYQMVTRLEPERFQHDVLVRTADEEAFTQLFRNADVGVVPCLNYKNPARYAINFKRVIDERGPYDILHIHGSNFNGLLSLLLARPLGIKFCIAHSHNDVRPLLKHRGRLYGRYSDAVRLCMKRLPDLGLAASVLAAESMFGSDWRHYNKYQLLYYGIDFTPFAQPVNQSLRHDLGIPTCAFVIGHVGRFHEQKNHEFLVEVADRLVHQTPDAHFLLIGDGDLRPEITREVEARGMNARFTYVADTLSVPALMTSAMDAFVFPSKYEGLGLVAVEAQAAGLPCVISDRVPREAIVDEDLVKVLPLEDPNAWAHALLSARASKRQCDLDALSQSRFNIDVCVEALSAVYSELASPNNERLAA